MKQSRTPTAWASYRNDDEAFWKHRATKYQGYASSLSVIVRPEDIVSEVLTEVSFGRVFRE